MHSVLKIAKKSHFNIDSKVTDQYGVTLFHTTFLYGQIKVVNAKLRLLEVIFNHVESILDDLDVLESFLGGVKMPCLLTCSGMRGR